MRRYLMLLPLLLVGCGPELAPAVYVPADLLVPPKGWTGPTPRDTGAFIDAAAASERGRQQCVGQLLTISEIVRPN